MNKINKISTFVSGGADSEETLNVFEERDQQGNTTLLKNYNFDGALDAKTIYEFDEKGRVIVEKQYSSGEIPDQVLRIEYNESGKAKQVVINYADGSVSYKNYSRSEADKTTTIDIVDQDGVTEGKEFRKFDSEDRVLEELIHTDTGAIERKAEFEYNEHGDLVESVIVDEEGFETVRFFDFYRNDKAQIEKIEVLSEDEVIIRVDEYEYDERGNQTKHSMKDLDRGSLFVDIRDYDENNNVVKFERLMGERPIEVTETKYTIDGLMERQETRSNDGVMIYRFEYEMF